MTAAAIHAEARRRFQRTNPQLAPEVFDTWLAGALRRRACIVLTLDGAMAVYDVDDANAAPPRGSNQGVR